MDEVLKYNVVSENPGRKVTGERLELVRMGLAKAIEQVGSVRYFCALADVTPTTVNSCKHGWMAVGHKLAWAIEVCSSGAVTKEQIRPDIFLRPKYLNGLEERIKILKNMDSE